ncbi:MAG: HIG1 domain-containing protein [Sphingomonas sp.]|uniref:HIG1 domain-containing protein n=1 Tax=Sphingomonas sp. TaxID=28214 RepID=UPI0025F76003|nr:HIG1 domain-containing protein [Sphingomonas sp.]MBX3565785.1 HIG1 domain-containing protein [Sphingomonas sp.]
MKLFLAFVLLALVISVGVVLIRGLVNMAGTTTADLEGEGPSQRALKSNKLMMQRILLQGLAILVIFILLKSAG